MNADDSLFTNEIHIHAGGDFGFRIHRTSHFESVWSFIKGEIRPLYKILPYKNYILFLKEEEYRYFIRNFDKEKKEKYFINILRFDYNLNGYDFFEEDELIGCDNYDY